MVLKSITKKIPGGKLFRIDVEFSDKIEKIKITGDFFLYPEDSINIIEKNFIGINVKTSTENIFGNISKKLNEKNLELIGVSLKDFCLALEEVYKNE